MPAGKPWFAHAPSFQRLAAGLEFWHIFDTHYPPLSSNPFSSGRFALIEPPAAKPSGFGMFYFANDLSGALWETVLREPMPDASGRVRVDPHHLLDQRAVQLRLLQPCALLDFSQPALRALFAPNSAEAHAVAHLRETSDYPLTHQEMREIARELRAHGIADLPVLAWPSRMCAASTAYLSFEPPMQSDWFEILGAPIALDDPNTGHPLIHTELARFGWHWTPLATKATFRARRKP